LAVGPVEASDEKRLWVDNGAFNQVMMEGQEYEF